MSNTHIAFVVGLFIGSLIGVFFLGLAQMIKEKDIQQRCSLLKRFKRRGDYGD